MKWFRMWVDIVDDVKMLQLSDYEYRMFTYLMAYASEVNSVSGELQTTFTLLSLHFHQRFNHYSRAIETFQKLGLITVSESGYVTITNWAKRQFKSDNAYERVKKFRDNQPTMKRFRNVSVTAPDTDTDKDTEKEKKKRKPASLKLTDDQWMHTLKSNPAYSSLDIVKIRGKCEAWCLNKNKMFTRARFLNWLNKEETPMGGDNGQRNSAEGNRVQPQEWAGSGKPLTDDERKRNMERIKTLTGEIG